MRTADRIESPGLSVDNNQGPPVRHIGSIETRKCVPLHANTHPCMVWLAERHYPVCAEHLPDHGWHDCVGGRVPGNLRGVDADLAREEPGHLGRLQEH